MIARDYHTKEDVVREAQKILNKSLRNILSPGDIEGIEKELGIYGWKRKGLLGELVEKHIFGLERNNRSEADFNIAGVELKTNPLKGHSIKKYVSKERLVFSMIDYDKIINETWEKSSFREKNKLLLILFYLWIKEQSILDYEFKFAHLLDLFKDISDEDIFQIQKDWEYIVAKIKRGEAHLLSEGDTYYLGACTKAANSIVVREQPGSRVPAKPRAFSLKQQYLNYLIQKELLGRDVNTDSIFKKARRIESVEDAFNARFSPYIGLTDTEIRERIKWKVPTKAKQYKRMLVNRILGVSSNRIEELEKANITLKVLTLEYSGTLKESVPFRAFDYNDLVTQVWYDEEDERMSEFHAQLETKKFLFVVFQKLKGSSDIVLKKTMFWNFPMKDISEAEKVWERTVACINEGRYEDLPKISDSKVAHIRPHGKDSSDVVMTPQGSMQMKKSFWLNAKYIQAAIENADLKP